MDAIFGAIDLYDWSKVKHWALSIKESGFTGDIHLVVFRTHSDVIENCKKLGIQLWSADTDDRGQPINHNVQGRDTQSHQIRFYYFWKLLQQFTQYESVIITDVRDVIFQRNPSEYLEACNRRQIILPSEAILFRDEEWNRHNFISALGMEAYTKFVEDRPVYNVGTIAGTRRYMEDLCYFIHAMGAGRYIPNDQAIFNLIANSELGNRTMRHHAMRDGWAAQCGTTLDPSKSFLWNKLLESKPVIDAGKVYTSSSPDRELFYLVHQWDRVPELNAVIEERYKGE